MIESQTIILDTRCDFDPTPGYISADAWAAVRIMGMLAGGPAELLQISKYSGSAVSMVSVLLNRLTRHGLVLRARNGTFALAFPAQALSIAEIIRAVDGNVLRNAPVEKEQPEIEEISA